MSNKRIVITIAIILFSIFIITTLLTYTNNKDTINATVTDVNNNCITLTDEQGEQWIIDSNNIEIVFNTNNTKDIYDDEIIDINISK